jgi:[acyl-carrier-protein] S-malonyltransferase
MVQADACTSLEFETGEEHVTRNRRHRIYAVSCAFMLGMMVAMIGLLTVQHYGLGDVSFTRFFLAPIVPRAQAVSSSEKQVSKNEGYKYGGIAGQGWPWPEDGLSWPWPGSTPAQREHLTAGVAHMDAKNFRALPRTALPSMMSASDSDNKFDGVAPKTVFMFPGQGAQALGMGVDVAKEVPAAAELYKKASAILGYDLLAIDDKTKLDTTAVSQPAIFVASMAAVEKLRATEGGGDIIDSANVACGLSLGEYTALAFAGAISFEDGVKITKARGEAMQAAADASSSGMVSIIGLNKETTGEVCASAAEATGKPIQIANYLCNGNYACSGAMEAVDKVVEIAKPEFKARMAVKLAVAGAFHTDFMAPAVSSLEEVLKSVEVKEPRIPVISNVDAKAHSDPTVIKRILTEQVTAPVQWETIMTNLVKDGFEAGYELGPGKVLAGIMKRIDKKAPAVNNIKV